MVNPKDFGFEEELIEVGNADRNAVGVECYPSGYPKPHRYHRVILEEFNQSIEGTYYWLLDHLRHQLGYYEIDKITDAFAASEHSAFFGVAWQRIGLQQDKVSQFLATIAKMIKEVFQIVRELRILDERMHYYDDSFTNSKSSESAEITLKGIWIDMVEGGAKNPASVYGMSRELQFTTLPDLFFSTHPKTPGEVDLIVDKLKFNRKVREVLKRKLRTFLEWKHFTYKELKSKRNFTLKYLRQHYDTIRLYMSWVKPYLRNIAKLQLESKKGESPDLIKAFEGSMVEIEVLAKKKPRLTPDYGRNEGGEPLKWVNACILANCDYRTRPSMSFQQEGYQRGPVHVGKTTVTMRCYSWTDKEVEKFKEMKEKEDVEMIGMIDHSLKTALDAMGDELEHYLKEAGETFLDMKKEKEKPEVKLPGMADPFLSVFKGIGEMFTPVVGKKVNGAKKNKKTEWTIVKEKEEAKKEAVATQWILYKNWKKGHGMLTW